MTDEQMEGHTDGQTTKVRAYVPLVANILPSPVTKTLHSTVSDEPAVTPFMMLSIATTLRVASEPKYTKEENPMIGTTNWNTEMVVCSFQGKNYAWVYGPSIFIWG